MKQHEKIFQQLREKVQSQFQFYVDESSEASIFVLPFKDNLGDNFVIRLKGNGNHYVLDDGGLIQNTLFVLSETIGGVKAGRLVSALAKSFGASLNQAGGTIELLAGHSEVVSKLLHFTKMLVTLDTMLVKIAIEEREMNSSWRPEGWKNPYREFGVSEDLVDRGSCSFRVLSKEEAEEADKHVVFENGASAILFALRQETLKEVGAWLEWDS